MPDFSPTSVSNNGDDPDPVTSPCISVCTVDPVSKLCIGCLRTLKEIGAWRVMTPDEKRGVVAACAERAKSISPRGRDGQPLVPAD